MFLHYKYLPFTEDQIKEHFDNSYDEHLAYYKKSADNYKNYTDSIKNNNQNAGIKDYRYKRQIEKDEKIWTLSALMEIYHSKNRNEQLIKLLTMAFGEKPPLKDFSKWEDCIGIDWQLFFEFKLPSPIQYKKNLKQNIEKRQFIPYVLENAKETGQAEYKVNLEGATVVDAIIINPDNGFALLIEAKVLSDISCQITYDTVRNQLARNIDVMLEDHSQDNNSYSSFRKIHKDKTLFMLLTPELFKINWRSRLYGYKFREYKEDPLTLMADLRHRSELELKDYYNIAERLGWITWEDLREINPRCCLWLDKTPEEIINV